MHLFIILIKIALSAFLFDQFCLWLERKGWLYYRNKKPTGGAIGGALQELNALLSPSNRHVIETKQNEVQLKKSEAGAKGEPVE